MIGRMNEREEVGKKEKAGRKERIVRNQGMGKKKVDTNNKSLIILALLSYS